MINIGVIPDHSIKAWLHHATVNLFPSTCETNSLVQSEILGAQGVMACSDVPPMTEVAGNAAALFNPYDPDSIAEVILRLCADDGIREDLRRRSAHRATELSWETCADATWSAVEGAVRRYRERRHSA